jgi:hypothetical protein
LEKAASRQIWPSLTVFIDGQIEPELAADSRNEVKA